MLALLDYEDQVCPGCGGWLPETTDPEAEGQYVADPPSRCHRCHAIQGRQEEYRSDETVSRPGALPIWPVRRK